MEQKISTAEDYRQRVDAVKEFIEKNYAKFVYQGEYGNLSAVYDAIYSRWLPESGLKLRDCPSFEKYINSPDRVPAEKLKTEIYLPIYTNE
jgi:AraC family transcriptional regulator